MSTRFELVPDEGEHFKGKVIVTMPNGNAVSYDVDVADPQGVLVVVEDEGVFVDAFTARE